MAKFCSECGVKLDDDAVFCGECGARLETELDNKKTVPSMIQPIVPQEISKPTSDSLAQNENVSKVFKMEPRKEFVCPKCHSENIQRFEIAYTSGIADTSATTVSGGIFGGIGGAVSKTQGTSQTVLSAQTAPPCKKGYIKKSLIAGVIVGILGGCVHANLGIIGFIAGAGFMVYKAYDFNNNVWPGMMERWRNSYICNRCGHTFVL